MAILAGCMSTGHAHDPGLSSAYLTVTRVEVVAVVTFSREEIETMLSPARSNFEQPYLNETLTGEILTVNGRAPDSNTTTLDDRGNVTFDLAWSGTADRSLRIRSPLLAKLNRGHRQHLIARNGQRDLIAQRFLMAGDDAIEMERSGIGSIPEGQPFPPDSGSMRVWIPAIIVCLSTVFYFAGHRSRLFKSRSLHVRHPRQPVPER